MRDLFFSSIIMSFLCLLGTTSAVAQGPLDMAFDGESPDDAFEDSVPGDNMGDPYFDNLNGDFGLDAGGSVGDDYDFGANSGVYDEFKVDDSEASFGDDYGVGGENIDPCAGGMDLFGDCDAASGATNAQVPAQPAKPAANTSGANINPNNPSVKTPAPPAGPPAPSSMNLHQGGAAVTNSAVLPPAPDVAVPNDTTTAGPSSNAVLMPGGILSESPSTAPAATVPAVDSVLSSSNVIQQPANEASEVPPESMAESFMLDDVSDPILPPAALPVQSDATYPVTDVSNASDAGAPLSASEPIQPTANDFAGAPAVPGTLRQVAEGEAPFEYKVEAGDTLYDVCDQLLDEAGYWPKLWSLNPEIKNPHFIYPDMQLRFYPGDSETPPYLQVVAEEDVIPIDKGLLEESLLIKQPIELVVEEVQIHDPRIEVIGPGDLEGASLDQFMVGGKSYNADTLKLQIPGFIFAQEREPLALISDGFDGRLNTGDGHSVLVEASNGIEPGLYSVLRYAGEVESKVNSEFEGHFYQFAANVKIEGQKGEDFYEGSVRNSRLGVRKGDILVPYISTLREIPLNSAPAGGSAVNASVVAFGERSQQIGGGGSFVFLDKGSRDGVTSGSYLPIFSQVDWRLKNEMSRPNGVIRILEADDISAIGYIVHNEFEIRIGDRTASF